jgi:glutamate synthase (NADPH/NADH) large chain
MTRKTSTTPAASASLRTSRARKATIIQQGLKILENLDHRGAVGADKLMGDGAGILIQIPDGFYREEMAKQGVTLPPNGEYGVGMIFLPKTRVASRLRAGTRTHGEGRGPGVLGWRDVPVDHEMPISPTVQGQRAADPQIFIGRGKDIMVTDALERKLYVIRKTASHRIQALKLKHGKEYFVPSMSARTVIYKGLLLAGQVGVYYRDLQDDRARLAGAGAPALLHQHLPDLVAGAPVPDDRAQRRDQHAARQRQLDGARGRRDASRARRRPAAKLWPISMKASRTPPVRQRARIPGAWRLPLAARRDDDDSGSLGTAHADGRQRRAFYEYHAAMMEPWDGPAAIAFTDGRQIGATLDRNGLRPARYLVTDDDLVVMASEMGVLKIPESKIVKKWRLQPGKMFLIDLEQGRIIDDEELKDNLANAKPYKSGSTRAHQARRIEPKRRRRRNGASRARRLLDRQQAFGYTQEDLKFLMAPMAQAGEEAVGSMGNDSPLAVMSNKNKTLYHYFKQLFAQVTNPPIDPIRENMVMSLVSFVGPKPNLLDTNNINPPMRLEVSQPVLDFKDIAKIRAPSISTPAASSVRMN